ncbi:Sbal_3080 family lipoprotein [Photobacterium leiognathi]|uniref:Sbal_3080 family lipoprotein n=1 Tax=Photobacterium leiognathi TaxID=553611 RepID=UPI0027350C6C|nr:Sbal_3080 family lipoprotein [Photobacterium leiognathi]
MLKKSLLLVLPFLLTACATPKYTVSPIQAANQDSSITIVKDDATRPVFLDSMQSWCLDSNHQCKTVADGSQPKPEELTLTYVSRWSWDFRTFIADATIKAYKNSIKVGEVEFKAPNALNTSKFGDDRKRINTMLELLFGKETVSQAQSKIKSGEI